MPNTHDIIRVAFFVIRKVDHLGFMLQSNVTDGIYNNSRALDYYYRTYVRLISTKKLKHSYNNSNDTAVTVFFTQSVRGRIVRAQPGAS